MAIALAVLLLLLVSWLFQILGVFHNSGRVFEHAREVSAIMLADTLSDREKEQRMQQQSLAMFRLFFLILLGSAGALGVPVAALYGLDAIGWVHADPVISVTLSWPFLVAALVFFTVLYLVRRSRD